MILRTEVLAELFEKPDPQDPLIITPQPDLDRLRSAGAASIDLRLGTWFAEFKKDRTELLDIRKGKFGRDDAAMLKKHYVPFGERFVLHPRAFILGVTLEWLRLPKNLAGYVTSRSSWGRRGLIIATATGVHPGFCGCLTLELTNVGEAPIALYPGIAISQFFLHRTDYGNTAKDQSRLIGKRQPTLGEVEMDEFANALATYGSGARLSDASGEGY